MWKAAGWEKARDPASVAHDDVSNKVSHDPGMELGRAGEELGARWQIQLGTPRPCGEM